MVIFILKKNNEKKISSSLKYYYKNKEKVLSYQKERWKLKYQNDANFRKKRQLRDKSRIETKFKNLSDEVCSECKGNDDLQRHHPSYSSSYFIILCRKCHNQLHNSLKGKEQSSLITEGING